MKQIPVPPPPGFGRRRGQRPDRIYHGRQVVIGETTYIEHHIDVMAGRRRGPYDYGDAAARLSGAGQVEEYDVYIAGVNDQPPGVIADIVLANGRSYVRVA